MKFVLRQNLNDLDRDSRHPNVIFFEFAKLHDLRVLIATPHPIGDCWIYEGIAPLDWEKVSLPKWLTRLGD